MESQGYPKEWVIQNGAGNALKSCRHFGSPFNGSHTSEHHRWNLNSIHYGFDEFGFSSPPGSYCEPWGSIICIGNSGLWWSSTEVSSAYAWGRSMFSFDGDVNFNIAIKAHGYSLRCAMNKTEPTTYNLNLEFEPFTTGTVNGAGEYIAIYLNASESLF